MKGLHNRLMSFFLKKNFGLGLVRRPFFFFLPFFSKKKIYKTATLPMQLRCCGMHTSLFPTRRIRLIGQVRTSSALSLHVFLPPLLICPFIERRILLFLFWGLKCLILLHILPLSLAFKFDHLVVSTFFFPFLFLSPELFPLPSQPRLPFSISALLLSLSWVWTLLRQNPFPKSISFLFAYFLRLCCTPALSRSRWGPPSESQFGMRTWFNSIL